MPRSCILLAFRLTNTHRVGAVEARWAHNPEVTRSKLVRDMYLIRCIFLILFEAIRTTMEVGKRLGVGDAHVIRAYEFRGSVQVQVVVPLVVGDAGTTLEKLSNGARGVV